MAVSLSQKNVSFDPTTDQKINQINTVAMCQKQMNALQQAPWSGCSENTSSGAPRVCAYGKRITARSSVSRPEPRRLAHLDLCRNCSVVVSNAADLRGKLGQAIFART